MPLALKNSFIFFKIEKENRDSIMLQGENKNSLSDGHVTSVISELVGRASRLITNASFRIHRNLYENTALRAKVSPV